MPEKEKQLNQTIPGGEYIVDGVKVNSEGVPIGKAKEAETAQPEKAGKAGKAEDKK